MSASPATDRLLADAVATVRRRWPDRPLAGIILGSGLGGLADEIAHPVRIDFADIPGFTRSTAAGHRGQLVCGTLAGVSILAMAGRIHRYEGHSDAQVTFPVRLMAALGAARMIVSNAAGGLNPLLAVGEIVVIRDHIDLAQIGAVATAGRLDRPVDADTVQQQSTGQRIFLAGGRDRYDRALAEVALGAARAGGFAASLGIYLAALGPTYETRAEYRMMRRFGADVVGMSTAPEVRVAHQLGMRVLGLSVVSNVAQSDVSHSTDHEEVLTAGRAAAFKLRQIVAAALVGGEE